VEGFHEDKMMEVSTPESPLFLKIRRIQHRRQVLFSLIMDEFLQSVACTGDPCALATWLDYKSMLKLAMETSFE